MNSVADFPARAQGWLKTPPDEWHVYPLKRILESNALALSEKTDPDYKLEYIDISSVSLSSGVKKTESMNFETAPSRARRIVRSGDVIVSTVRTYLRAIAHIKNADSNLIASTGFAVLTPCNKINSEYFGFFATSHPFVEAIVAQSVGASYPATNASDIVRLRMPVPPLPFQKKIATYLQRKISEINNLISKKQDLLELLAEKRSALITHAVTKGINPDTPMKPSGIDWLGDIPEHWEIAPMWTSILKLESGVSVNAMDSPANKDELGILKTSCVYTGSFDPSENKVVYDAVEAERLSCAVRGGEIIISRMNTPDLVGAAGVIDKDYPNLFLPDRLWQTYFDCSSKASSKFIYLYLNCSLYRAIIASIATGSSGSMQNISKSDLLKIKLAIPPKHEQSAIVEYVSLQTAEIDRSKQLVVKAIEVLSEYRSAIITKAVIGELEVA